MAAVVAATASDSALRPVTSTTVTECGGIYEIKLADYKLLPNVNTGSRCLLNEAPKPR